MSTCDRDHELEDALVKQAQLVVLGVVTARDRDNQDDAAFLINGYLSDALEAGATIGTAWALLFSASTLWVAALMRLHAQESDQTPLEAIGEIALAYALKVD